MHSMTGFGRASGENAAHAVDVALRGVNHRFLDLRMRVEDLYAGSEPALRALLSGEVRRGRVDVRIEVRRLGRLSRGVVLDEGVLEALKDAVQRLEEGGWSQGGLSTADLLRMPEVVSLETPSDTWTAEDDALLLSVAGRALKQLADARESEGERLREALAAGVRRLEELVETLEEQRQQAVEDVRQGLEKRLAELLDRSRTETSRLDPGRLEQEVAVLVDRSDVREELDRLSSHLSHFRTLMDQEGSVGKRLDFVAQEIMRELNTLGAKCRDPGLIRSVLEGKSICEQLREQVQNVE